MGCGCGKTGKSRTERVREKRLRLFKSRLNKKSTKTKVDKLTASVQAQRRSLCGICPHAVQTKAEKKARLRRCHKTNRFITHLVVDMKFKCPIGRFKAVS